MNIPRSFGLKKSGIYCIINSINNKIYIGSSVNIYHRLKRHYSELKRGIHTNKYLQNSYLKHGSSNFNVSIIEETTIENLQQLEQYYINTLNPNYNLTTEVLRNTLSPESRLKVSNTFKEYMKLGIHKYPTHDDKKKPVIIYDKNCNCIGKYESEKSASKKLEELYIGLKNSQAVVNSVINLRNGRKVSRYKNHFLLKPDQKCNNEQKFRSDGKKIKIINITSGEEYILPSLMEASKIFNCNHNSIKRALIKMRPLLKKYKVINYDS